MLCGFLIIWKVNITEWKAMKELLDSMSQPIWWLSTVIVAFIINLLAAYAKPILDNLYSKHSIAWRERVQREYQRRQLAVHAVASDRLLYLELMIQSVTRLIIIMFLFSWLIICLLYFQTYLAGLDKELFHLSTISKSIFIVLAIIVFIGVIYLFNRWRVRASLLMVAGEKLHTSLTAQNNAKTLFLYP